MYPSFKDKADREQKQADLLAKAERRSRQAYVKRGMYEEAIWASEADKVVAASKPSTSSETQTDESVQSQLDPFKKSQSEPTSVDELPYEGLMQSPLERIPESILEPEPIPEPIPESLPVLRLDPRLADEPHAAQQTIKEWFTQYPGLVELRVNPINLDGSINSNYVIGKKGLLYHSRTGKVARNCLQARISFPSS